MKTLFLLSRDEISALRAGEPFVLQVGNGVEIVLQAEQKWTKRLPIVRSPKPTARPKRRAFSPRQKAKILKDAQAGVSQAARKHQLSRSVIDRWRRERSAA